MKGEKEASLALVQGGIILAEANIHQSSFLKLLFQPQECKINHLISTEQ